MNQEDLQASSWLWLPSRLLTYGIQTMLACPVGPLAPTPSLWSLTTLTGEVTEKVTEAEWLREEELEVTLHDTLESPGGWGLNVMNMFSNVKYTCAVKILNIFMKRVQLKESFKVDTIFHKSFEFRNLKVAVTICFSK